MPEDKAELSFYVPEPAEPEVRDADAVPRVLRWAVVKRIDPRMPNTWGHWWIELDDEQSYGWWPTPCPMGWRGAMLGSRGCLNGMGAGTEGTATRDAYHGDEPDHCFHPTLIVDKTDEQVRADIRAFAHSYVGAFRWQWWWLKGPAQNCRTFQDEMFQTVGLFEEPEYLYSRGSGCPFMFPFRQLRWGIVDAVASAVQGLRHRSPIHRRRNPLQVNTHLATGKVGARHQPDTSPPSLTDARARARARINGTLLPDPSESPDG